MITAQQVAHGMALQQQQHAQLTAGASGMMQSQPAMGMSQYPPQFSYAMPGGANASRSGLAGAAVMGGMAGGLNAVGAVSNVVGMGSTALGLGGMALNAGGALGLGTGALGSTLLTASGPVLAPLIGAGALAGTSAALNASLQQTQQVNQIFGNMQFANMGGDPRTGRGFSQNDLGTLQRGIQAINANNPFVSMSDALRATERFTDMGMHQGVQDAERMARKITEMGKTMHKMARIMGTSMEEAGRALGSMRSSGFYTASDVMGNTASMNIMRGYGMTSDQFSMMQASGAAATRGAQLSGRAGASFVAGAAQDIMGGIKAGVLSGEQIMDITGGASPAEAAQIMAQQSLGATMQGFSGAGGTAILTALGRMENGRYTGEIDTGLMRQMAEGRLTYQDIIAKGGSKIGSGRNAQVSFVANQKDIMDSALQNPEASNALLNLIRAQAKEMGEEGEDFVQILAQTQFNMDRRQFRILSKMAEDRKKGHRERLASLKREMDTSSRAAYIRENRTLGGALQRATGTAEDMFQQGMVNRFSEFQRDVTEVFQGIERAYYGDVEMNLSAASLREAVMTGSGLASAPQFADAATTARFALSTGNMDAFTGTLGVSDELLGKVDLKSVDSGARSAMSSARGGVAARKFGGYSARSAKLKKLREQVRKQVPTASADEVDAIIARSGAAGARLVTQDRSRTGVLTDVFGGEEGEGGGRAASLKAAQAAAAEAAGFNEVDPEGIGQRISGMWGAATGAGMMLGGAAAVAALFAAPVTAAAVGLAVGGVGLFAAGAALGMYSAPDLLGDTDLEDMEEDFISGKAGTELVAEYRDPAKQKIIDKVISDAHASANTLEEGNAIAAEKLSKLLGRPVKARDVSIAEKVMTRKTKKNASERLSLSKEERAKMTRAAEGATGLLFNASKERIGQSLQSLGTSLTIQGEVSEQTRAEFQKAVSGLTEEGGLENLAKALKAASGGEFSVTGDAHGNTQVFQAGVDTYTALAAAGEDGSLTMEEMAKATNLSQEEILSVMKTVGVSATDGGVFGRRDIEKITGQLSARMVGGVLAQGEEGIQRVLDSGKTEQQITAESVTKMADAVNKTTEMTEALYKAVSTGSTDVQISKPEEGAG